MKKLLERHPYMALAICFLFLYLVGNSLLAVTDTAEANYAQTAKEMVLSGNWISPQIYGQYWYDKTIFYYWELALSFKLFGFNEMAARLPAALLGVASVLFTYWFARKVYGAKVGWLSALILGTSVECWLLSKAVITDSTLFLFVSASIAFFYLGYTENKKYYYLCYVFAALATLTKGPIGLFLPGMTALVFLGYKKDWQEMKHVHLFSGLLLFIGLCGAWYGTMCYLHGSDFLLNFLGVHNFLRATVSEHPSKNHWYFYIIVYFLGFAPWSFALPVTLYKKWKAHALHFKTAAPVSQLLLIYGAVTLVFFQLVATKYTTYTFPAHFSLAILTAGLYKDCSLKIERTSATAMVCYTLLTLFVAPSIMLMRSGKEAGLALAQMDTGDAPIAFVDGYRTSTVFYSGKNIYWAVPRDKIEEMKPGGLSWNAKNVMPLMAEEDLYKNGNAIVLTQDKNKSPFITAFTKTTPTYAINIPGEYTIWVKNKVL